MSIEAASLSLLLDSAEAVSDQFALRIVLRSNLPQQAAMAVELRPLFACVTLHRNNISN